MSANWLTPKAITHEAGGKGRGSFAIASISAGETVAAFGGTMMTRAQLDELTEERAHRSIQIDDDLYLVSDPVADDGDLVNHSCDPNCGLMGSVLVVALREIAVGEELAFDYAMCDASDYDEFTCLCGVADCRGVVRGTDWRDPVLQVKYRDSFSPYLVKRITALNVEAQAFDTADSR